MFDIVDDLQDQRPHVGGISQEERNRRFQEMRENRQRAQEDAQWEEQMAPPAQAAPEAPRGPSPFDPQAPEGAGEPAPETAGSGVAGSIARAAVRGAGRAVDETASFFTLGKFRPIGEDRLPLAGSDHGGYAFVEGMAQFVTGFVGAGKVMAPLRIGRRVYKGLRGAGVGKRGARFGAVATVSEAAGFVTDFVAFNPYQERLADLVANSGPEFAQPVAEWLAADDDDPELWARTKAGIEGVMLGLALGSTIEGASRLIRLSGIHERFKRGKITKEQAEKRAAAVENEPWNIDDSIAIWHGQHESVLVLRNLNDLEVRPHQFIDPPVRESLELEGLLFDDAYMWHAGTAAKDILRGGLKSREQLGRIGKGKTGLGGGPDNTVSVTYSREHAEEINAMQRLVSRIARNEATPEEVVDRFRHFLTEESYLDEGYLRDAIDGYGRHSPFSPEARARLMDGEGETWGEFLLRKGFADETEVPSQRRVRELMEEWENATSELDPDTFARVLREELANMAPDDAQEALMYLALSLDWAEPDQLRRVYFVQNPREAIQGWKDVMPEDLQIFQVGARKGVKPISEVEFRVGEGESRVIPHEYEIQFRPEDVELLDRIVYRNEQQAAALDMVYKARERSYRDISPTEIKAALAKIQKRMAGDVTGFRGGNTQGYKFRAHMDPDASGGRSWVLEVEGPDGRTVRTPHESAEAARDAAGKMGMGAPTRVTRTPAMSPDDPELYRDIGLNLGLIVKNYDDFKRVSGSVAKVLGDLHKEARFDPPVSPKTFAELEERSLAEFRRIFGESTSLADIRAWADDLGAVSLQDAAVKVDAGMKMLLTMGQDIGRLARAFDLSTGPERIALQTLLEDMVQTFAHVQVRVLGQTSEGGRFLNFMKKKGQEITGEVLDASMEAARAGARAEPKKLTNAEAMQLARNLRLTKGDPEMIRKVLMHTSDIHRMAPQPDPRFMDKVNWFRIGMLLSGPKTQAINFLNNTFTAFQVPVEHFWAGVRSGDRQLRQFGQDEIAGILMNLTEAFRFARRTWRESENILDPTFRTDEGQMLKAPNPIEKIGQWAKTMVDLPGRALMTSDEFFRQLSYRGHVRAQALMMAREDALAAGLRQDSPQYARFLNERVAQHMEGAFTEAGHALNPLALEHSRYVTFQNQLGDKTLGGQMKHLANEYPTLRFIMPFIRTPVNLFRFAVQRTPVLGRFQHQMKQDLAAGGHRAEIAKARLEVGWVLWGSAAALMLGGKLTGGGPSEPNMRRQWLALGNQPYSFQLPGGNRISFHRIEPMLASFGVMADAMEAISELPEEEMTTVAYAAVAGMLSSITSKTFLMGLSEALSAVEAGNPGNVRRWMNSMATSTVTPAFLNQINHDPVLREARSLVDEMRRRVPGLSETLEPRRNLFGEQVMKPLPAFGMEFGGVGTYANRSLNPFTTMQTFQDPEVADVLMELGKALPYPQPTRMEGNIDLRDRKQFDNGTGQSPYDRMFEIVSNPSWGPPLRQQLESIVKSEQFQRLGAGNETFRGGAQYEMLRRIVHRYYQAAEKQMMSEYPLLLQEMERLGRVRAEGWIGTGQLERDERLFSFVD